MPSDEIDEVESVVIAPLLGVVKNNVAMAKQSVSQSLHLSLIGDY